jgi:hypothetical protein
MTIEQIVTQILSVITPVGAAIVYVMNERRKAKDQAKKESLEEAERERTYSERVSNRLKVAEETIERITRELTEERLKQNKHVVPSDILREFVDADPGVSWVKRRMGPGEYVMIRCSKAFAKQVLEGPPELYDGKTDTEVWGKETAEFFKRINEEMYKKQEGIHITQKTPKGLLICRKFPIRLPDGGDYFIGVGTFENVEKDDEKGLLKFADEV